MSRVDFHLNGKPCSLPADDGRNLLELLREEAGIRSIKDGCSPEGICGCCTILIDGRPVLACKTRPCRVEGKEVTTLEGLSDAERKLLARAFADEQAVQCGFCTPGIVMRTHALLKINPAPDEDRIQSALKGHLCRCTGYKSIERAIKRASSGHMRDFAEGEGIGAGLPRYKAEALALGERPFVADMAGPEMLHAALVFSPHPRARLLSLDPAPVMQQDGVVAVYTWKDIPGQRYNGLIVKDWPLMVAVGEESRCVGDVLAVVVAKSRHQAREARQALRMEWEVLEPVSVPEAALAQDAERVHESGNLLDASMFRRGDVQSEMASAEHCITGTFETQRIEHAFLEPEACLAKPLDDGLLVYSQGQGVHDDARQIAAILNLPLEKVLVELVPNGGAFGGKEDLSIQGQTALAAWLGGEPVHCALSREESLRLHPKRHPIRMHYQIAADAEGMLKAAHIRMIGDTGAYASVGAKVLERAAGHSCGPYHVPAVDVEARAAYTNNPPCGAMRGFGVNQAAFAIESLLDELAVRTGIDRFEIRRRNILRPGLRFATGQIMNESVRGLERCLDAVEQIYREHPAAGLALGIKNTGIGNGMTDSGRVRIRVTDQGRLEINTGFTEMGQGLFTILRQIVAEETGLPVAIMDVATRSEEALLCGMTTASRATALAGAAAGDAARKLSAVLKEQSLPELAEMEFNGEFHCSITTKPGADVENPVTHMTFSYAAQLVLMNEEGRITELVAAHDVGRAINPASCVGQLEGSLHMGLGYALSEDFPCIGGQPVSLRLKDAGVLRAHETPPMKVILIEEPDPIGGYGVKGIGEIGLVPTAAAVASALRQYDGRMRTSLPMKQDRDRCLKRTRRG